MEEIENDYLLAVNAYAFSMQERPKDKHGRPLHYHQTTYGKWHRNATIMLIGDCNRQIKAHKNARKLAFKHYKRLGRGV